MVAQGFLQTWTFALGLPYSRISTESKASDPYTTTLLQRRGRLQRYGSTAYWPSQNWRNRRHSLAAECRVRRVTLGGAPTFFVANRYE